MSKTKKPQGKNQVVLPKLEGDFKFKPLKDIEREMDLEMLKIMEQEMNCFKL